MITTFGAGACAIVLAATGAAPASSRSEARTGPRPPGRRRLTTPTVTRGRVRDSVSRGRRRYQEVIRAALAEGSLQVHRSTPISNGPQGIEGDAWVATAPGPPTLTFT